MEDPTLNVEEPEPTTPEATPEDAAAPAPAPETPEPPEDELPEGAVEQENGQVMVPLAALRAEREAAKVLKEKASRADQAWAYAQQVKPYVDFLQANPDLMQRRQAPETTRPQPAAPTPEQAQASDAAAEQFARTLDLYTVQGKPDVERAKQVLSAIESRAETKAREAITPFAQMSVQQRAAQNLKDAKEAQLGGVRANPEILEQIWASTDPRMLATEQGAASAVLLALGLGQLQQQQGQMPPQDQRPPAGMTPAPAAPTPPVVSEPSGSRSVGRMPLTDLDQRVMRVRGIDAKRYAEIAKAFKPGVSNTLEED